MDILGFKCVMVIDGELSAGLIANTAAVLGLTLGRSIEGIIGPDVLDKSGNLHVGITTMPIPILRGTKSSLKTLMEKILSDRDKDLFVVDFSDAAQTTTDYESYTRKIASHNSDDLGYLGIALFGDKRKVNRLTGSLPLLR